MYGIQEERKGRRNMAKNMDSQIWMTRCTESQSHADYTWKNCSGSAEEAGSVPRLKEKDQAISIHSDMDSVMEDKC
jgi:hypothetical protein